MNVEVIKEIDNLYKPNNKSFVAQFNKDRIQYLNYYTQFNSQLKSNTEYRINDRTDRFITGNNGEIVEVHTRYGIRGHPNPELAQYALYPNCIYYVHENIKQYKNGDIFVHIFYTDEFACVEKVSVGKISFPRTQGDRQPMNKVWEKYKSLLKGMDRGHLISKQMGGGMEDINIVTMSSASNRLLKVPTIIRLGFSQLTKYRKLHNIPFPDNQINKVTGTASLNANTGIYESANYREFEQRVKCLYDRSIKTKEFYVSMELNVVYSHTFKSTDNDMDSDMFNLCRQINAIIKITDNNTNKNCTLYRMELHVLEETILKI